MALPSTGKAWLLWSDDQGSPCSDKVYVRLDNGVYKKNLEWNMKVYALKDPGHIFP